MHHARLGRLVSADMSWLVTGGAGYIGSHVVQALAEAGMSPVVIDDLSVGPRVVRARRRAVRRGEPARRTARRRGHAARPPGGRRDPPGRLQVRRGLGRAARCTPTSRTSPAPSACCEAMDDAGVEGARVLLECGDVRHARRRPGDRGDADRTRSRRTASRKLIGEWLLRDVGRARRAAAHVAALLQRGRLRLDRSCTTPARTTCSRSSSTRWSRAGRRTSTATTTRRRTAPASATTCTSPTWPRRTSPPLAAAGRRPARARLQPRQRRRSLGPPDHGPRARRDRHRLRARDPPPPAGRPGADRRQRRAGRPRHRLGDAPRPRVDGQAARWRGPLRPATTGRAR